jgi:hypothetical protein
LYFIDNAWRTSFEGKICTKEEAAYISEEKVPQL